MRPYYEAVAGRFTRDELEGDGPFYKYLGHAISQLPEQVDRRRRNEPVGDPEVDSEFTLLEVDDVDNVIARLEEHGVTAGIDVHLLRDPIYTAIIRRAMQRHVAMLART